MNKIQLISKLCDKYPQKLLKIENAPDIIFAMGNLSLLNTFSIAVIGSRNFTMEAKTLTQSLVKDLVKEGITIVSGMARGIDTIAHEACMDEGGKTIAILGSGLLSIANQKVASRILSNDGLIISEYFPDVPPLKFNFPRRNSLISGISDGVVITEARENSGSLITADFAQKQNKNIFSFPWNIDNENYYGNNLLLTQGAKCILSYSDILKYYPDFKTKNPNRLSNKSIPVEYLKIYSLLKRTPTPINTLLQNLNMKLSELQYNLTMMEIEGLITRLPNNFYVKI